MSSSKEYKTSSNADEGGDLEVKISSNAKHKLSGNDDDNSEVILLTQIRLALSSMLQMLEMARENLIYLGSRLDKLREASEKCRLILQQKYQLEKIESS